MYFRTGRRPVLGNTIRSAASRDGSAWTHDPGDRVIPGHLWDSHGAGFPDVTSARAGGGFEMRYCGYWGASPAARQTRRRWEEHAEALRAEALAQRGSG